MLNFQSFKVKHNNNVPEYDDYKFPRCRKPGKFRVPSDCSLYYTCSVKTNGKFYQTRYR